MTSFTLGGAHRGAIHTLNALHGDVDQVIVVDPKPGRANALASRFERRGARDVTTHEARLEDLLTDVPVDLPMVVAIDELSAMREVVERFAGLALLQAIGRATGGAAAPMFAFNFATDASRLEHSLAVAQLLRALERLAPNASSTVLKTDTLRTHRGLALRAAAAKQTVGALADPQQVLGRRYPSTVHLRSGEAIPLAIASAETGDLRVLREQALSSAGQGTTAVALIGKRDVDILVVEPGRKRGGQYVRAHLPFHAPPPVEVRSARPAVTAPAFTD